MDNVRLTRREMLMGMAATMLALPEESRWESLATFLESEQKAGVFPGAALIAAKKGRVVYERYAGTYCGLKRRDLPLDGSVIHPLYSYSKLISATVVAMVHQDGLLDYNAPVSRYIPEFTGEGKENITLRHLLTHSAGIPNVPLGPVLTEEQWQTAVHAACAAKTEWEPGSRTLYHGLSGLFVAAEAARRVTGGKSWDRLCRERLFDPLGAATLSFSLPSDDAPVALTPQPKDLPARLQDALSLAGHPAGGCLGTPADALKVLQLHLNGGTWNGRRLIGRPALREMHTVQYRREIAKARAEGRTPDHDPWGLGPLLRGEGPKTGSHDWFGFANQVSPGVFGHAGIDTVIGVADMATGRVLFFITTDSPKPPEKTVPLRNGVTDRVFTALEQTSESTGARTERKP